MAKLVHDRSRRETDIRGRLLSTARHGSASVQEKTTRDTTHNLSEPVTVCTDGNRRDARACANHRVSLGSHRGLAFFTPTSPIPSQTTLSRSRADLNMACAVSFPRLTCVKISPHTSQAIGTAGNCPQRWILGLIIVTTRLGDYFVGGVAPTWRIIPILELPSGGCTGLSSCDGWYWAYGTSRSCMRGA